VTEGDGVIGYKSPPRSRRYPTGVSGNPKGRPKRKRGLPYAWILDCMVRIKDGRGARQVTAEEAFLFYLRKKAVDGDESAQERLEEIQAFRREHDPDLGSQGITTIVRVIVSPDNPNYALRLLKMAVRLYPLTSRPNQARAMACPARARSAWRPAPKCHGAGNRRGRDADAWEGPMAGLVGNILWAKANAGAAAGFLYSALQSR
jgi:hypothetical protein